MEQPMNLVQMYYSCKICGGPDTAHGFTIFESVLHTVTFTDGGTERLCGGCFIWAGMLLALKYGVNQP